MRYNEGFLSEMDGRAEVTRTLRQRLRELVSDLGGLDGLSYQERSLCRRVIHLERHVERKELRLAHGGYVDEAVYLNSLNVLSGLFSKIGLKRRSRPIPTLEEYLNSKEYEDETAPGDETEKSDDQC